MALEILREIFTLGIEKMSKPYDPLLLLAPYVNEFANLISHATYLRIYDAEVAPSAKTLPLFLSTQFFNFAGLLGIVANSAQYGDDYDILAGVVKGGALVVFSYFVPNFLMPPFLELVDHVLHGVMLFPSHFLTSAVKLFFGAVFVYFLDVGVNVITVLYKRYGMPERPKAE